MSNLLQKLKKQSVIKSSELVSESRFFKESELLDTGVYALNIILSARVNGGLSTGFTMLAAPKATSKTIISLKMVSAYLNKYPDGACIFYDSEHGASLDYFKSQGVDTSRVLHIPISSIEELKFDMVQQLEGIEEGEKVIFLIDSLGMLASTKEATDALNQKSVADMTKAKELASFSRLVTPALSSKGLICIGINHVYQDITSMYGGKINAGGEKLQYAASTIIQISKSQEKEGKDLVGFQFTLHANKSRYVKEKSTIPFIMTFEGGINKLSGLFDLALELEWNHVILLL